MLPVTPMPLAPHGYVPESAPFERPSGASIGMYPSLRPRSGRTILLAFTGALVLGAGGLVGFMMSKSDPAAAAVEPEPASR
jgi:hypothetical protein